MTAFINRTTPSNRLAILLFLGALQVLAYYFVGSMLTPRPFSVACPQPDTLLYCQSACCAFGQTDTGLIMGVTAGVFAAWHAAAARGIAPCQARALDNIDDVDDIDDAEECFGAV